MLHQSFSKPRWFTPARAQGLLFLGLLLALSLCAGRAAYGQANLAGVCPNSCGVKIQITKAAVTEANDGVLVKVDWTMDAPNPALNLTKLGISVKADLGIDNVKNNIDVGVDKRTATIKLSRLLEFDVKDVKNLQVDIVAFANPLPPVPVNVTDRKIVGQGRDSAVEVKWNAPGPLACTASLFSVKVSALNEKNNQLTGQRNVSLSTRSVSVELKGDINKKGLHAPGATVEVTHNALGCTAAKNFPAGQFNAPIGAGTGSFGPDSAKVTITKLALRDDGTGRVDAEINWEVFEPTNFKSSSFNLKFDVEDASGKISTLNRPVPGINRSTFAGSLAAVNNFRRLTLTITATLQNTAQTAVVTREAVKAATLAPKQTPQVAVPLAPPPPPSPSPSGFSASGSANAPNPVVTLKPIRFSAAGSRIESEIFWDVVEPQGFKASRFDLKIESDRNGNIGTLNLIESGNKRSTRGPESQVSDGLRGVTVTIKATFTNTAGTQILTRENKLTQPFTTKSTIPSPVAPQPQNLGLNVAAVKINSAKNVHNITVGWQVAISTGITVTGFSVEATALGNQNQVQRSVEVSGQAVLANINFTFGEVGDKLSKVQVRVTANGRRADGSTIQQTATGEGQPIIPPPPPPPPAVQLKVNGLNANTSGSNFFVNGSWIIELQPGIAVQNFIVEAALLKPKGPTRKTTTLNAAVRQQSFSFTAAEASGVTTVEMKVTANLRRADGTTFQETSIRQAGN